MGNDKEFQEFKKSRKSNDEMWAKKLKAESVLIDKKTKKLEALKKAMVDIKEEKIWNEDIDKVDKYIKKLLAFKKALDPKTRLTRTEQMLLVRDTVGEERVQNGPPIERKEVSEILKSTESLSKWKWQSETAKFHVRSSSPTTIQCRQDRYTNKTFKETLAASQELVKEVSEEAKSHGFSVQEGSDTVPFVDPNGKSFRLWDMQLISSKPPYYQLNVECKDFASALAFNATGLPQSYIDKKMMLSNNGENLILVFRQNAKWIDSYAGFKKISAQKVMDFLLKMGFAKYFDNIGIDDVDNISGIQKINGEGTAVGCTDKDLIKLLPYGNLLSVLMKKENRDIRAEDRVQSRLSSYYGEKQYMFKLSAMLPLDKLFKEITSKK